MTTQNSPNSSSIAGRAEGQKKLAKALNKLLRRKRSSPSPSTASSMLDLDSRTASLANSEQQFFSQPESPSDIPTPCELAAKLEALAADHASLGARAKALSAEQAEARAESEALRTQLAAAANSLPHSPYRSVDTHSAGMGTTPSVNRPGSSSPTPSAPTSYPADSAASLLPHHAQEIAALQAEIAAKEASIEDLKRALAEKQHELLVQQEGFKDQVSDLEAALSAKQSEFDEMVAIKDANVAALQEALTAADTAVSQLQTQLKATNDKQEATEDELVAAVAASVAATACIRGQVAGAEAEAARLRGRLAAAEAAAEAAVDERQVAVVQAHEIAVRCAALEVCILNLMTKLQQGGGGPANGAGGDGDGDMALSQAELEAALALAATTSGTLLPLAPAVAPAVAEEEADGDEYEEEEEEEEDVTDNAGEVEEEEEGSDTIAAVVVDAAGEVKPATPAASRRKSGGSVSFLLPDGHISPATGGTVKAVSRLGPAKRVPTQSRNGSGSGGAPVRAVLSAAHVLVKATALVSVAALGAAVGAAAGKAAVSAARRHKRV